MNCRDFVTETDLKLMRMHINARSPFEHKREKKEGGTKFTLSLHSSVVDDHLAESIWHGNHYIVHFSSDYSGGKLGWGGVGFATTEYKIFDTWDSFKGWIDKQMSRYGNYETEEYGQLCLF